jgi:hypothetical protein
MADIDGSYMGDTANPLPGGNVVEEPIPGDVSISICGGSVPSGRFRYRMQGWNTFLGYWEVWESEDVPNPTPPVGPCSGVKITSKWELV